MLSITGLPLVFHDKINAVFDDDIATAMIGAASAKGGVSLDVIITKAMAKRPGEVPLRALFQQKVSSLKLA